jgi:hypothetical protein
MCLALVFTVISALALVVIFLLLMGNKGWLNW